MIQTNLLEKVTLYCKATKNTIHVKFKNEALRYCQNLVNLNHESLQFTQIPILQPRNMEIKKLIEKSIT